MRMDINKRFCIISSRYELTVYLKSVGKNKEGKTIEVLVATTNAHCNTIAQACKTLLDNTIKDSTAINDLKQVSDELRQMKADIDKSLASINIDKLTEEYKKYDDLKFEETKSKNTKLNDIDDEEDKEYDSSECGKPMFDSEED